MHHQLVPTAPPNKGRCACVSSAGPATAKHRQRSSHAHHHMKARSRVAVTPPRPSRPARPRLPLSSASRACQQGSAAPVFSSMRALTVLITAWFTAPAGGCRRWPTRRRQGCLRSPAAPLVSTTRALDRFERPRPAATVAVTPRQKNRASTGQVRRHTLKVVVAGDTGLIGSKAVQSPSQRGERAC